MITTTLTESAQSRQREHAGWKGDFEFCSCVLLPIWTLLRGRGSGVHHLTYFLDVYSLLGMVEEGKGETTLIGCLPVGRLGVWYNGV
jgi:hypothetical protein